MTKLTKYKTTLILSLLTPLLLVVVVFLMGGGHGTYAPAILFFPTGLVSFSIFGQLRTPFIILAVIQFPTYGLLFDKLKNKAKTISFILVFHFALVIIISITTKNF
jgi:hypothetical protein